MQLGSSFLIKRFWGNKVIDQYGVTHFKIKICGQIETDLPRLEAIATLLKSRIRDFKFTLDDLLIG